MIYYWPISLLAFAGGILLGFYQLWPALLAISAFLWLTGFAQPNLKKYLILVMVTIWLGYGYESVRTLRLVADLPTWPDTACQGRIVDFPVFDEGQTIFTLKTDDPSPYRQKIRVVCLFEASLGRGDVVSIKGDLEVPRPPGNPGEMDFPTYLAHQGVFYNLAVTKFADLEVRQNPQGMVHHLDSFRSLGIQVIKEKLGPAEAAILLGMILGGRTDIADDQYQDFQKVGIVHLFSVGGLHTALLLALVGYLGWLLGWSKNCQCITGILVLLLYGTLLAWPPPVVRAVIMAAAASLAYYSGRGQSLLNALALAGWAMLLINPEILFSISFQLTMLATWGLVYIFPRFRKALARPGWVLDLFLIPLAAELAVLPLVAYYFYMLTPVSLLTNILITYLASGAVILGFIAFGCCAWPGLSALLLYPAGWMIQLIIWITAHLKTLPGAYFWIAQPSIVLIVIYYAGLVVLSWSLGRDNHRRYRGIALGLIVAAIASLLVPAGWYKQGIMEIVFLDVGQGDATLIKTPQGKYILVDGGGSEFYDVGAKKLLPYLHYRGIRHLDMIINTHPDIDHTKGLESVIGDTEVDCLVLPASIADRKEYQELRVKTNQHRIPLYVLGTGDQLKLGNGAAIKILNPERVWYDGSDLNQESLVLQLSYGQFAALLTGDIPKAKMSEVMQKVELPIDILKVPHHGSKGSLLPGFYQKLRPTWALVSVGDNNPFGHPNREVIDALTKAGSKILRTDQIGAVTVSSDGKTYQVHTYRNIFIKS